jgi:predicted CoA-binding protein
MMSEKEKREMADTELQLLQRYKHIAVVGLSADPSRASYSVTRYMQMAGYEIIPINPRYAGTKILGKHVYRSLTEAKEAGEQIEIVDVFRRSEDTLPVADEAIKVEAKAVWLQLGIANQEASEKVRNAGLEFVEDKCIKVEHARLLA